MTFSWRPISEVPAEPCSALLAVFSDEDDEPYLLDGIWITHKGRWIRENDADGTENPPDGAFWIDEEALFAAHPLARPA